MNTCDIEGCAEPVPNGTGRTTLCDRHFTLLAEGVAAGITGPHDSSSDRAPSGPRLFPGGLLVDPVNNRPAATAEELAAKLARVTLGRVRREP